MGRFAIAVYKPKDGKRDQLLRVVRKHMEVLRAEQLVGDRSAYVMQAGNGAVVEVFEWLSADAIRKAHELPAVQALWAEFSAVCDFVPLATLPEAQDMFAEFDSLDL